VHGNAVAGAAAKAYFSVCHVTTFFYWRLIIPTGILQLTLWYRRFTREDACVLSGEEEWSEGGKDLLTVWLCFHSS